MLQEALGSSVALAHASVQSLGHGFYTVRWVEVTSETWFFTSNGADMSVMYILSGFRRWQWANAGISQITWA